jgi:DNA polymerase
MTRPLSAAALEDALRARIGYLRDLGIFDLYRREAGPEDLLSSLQAAADATGEQPSETNSAVAEPASEAHQSQTGADSARSLDSARSFFEEDQTIAARKTPLPIISFTPGPLIAPAARAEALEALRQEIGPDCTRCPLGFAGRHKVVFGDGDPNARLLFVGEGPGADEDLQGIPFVGRAGQLLNNMIAAMGLNRQQVYIANVVKCRPPKNRVPEPVEAITCSQFLLRQIDIVRPQVIVALGSTAATYLLGSKSPLSVLRGRVHSAHGAQFIVTYHPAYLLRDPTQKKAAWADLQLAMKQMQPAD